MTVFFDARQNCWVYDFREGGKRFNRRAKNPDGTPAQSKRQAHAAEDAARVAARLDQRHALAPRPGEYTLAQAVAARATEAKHLANWRDIKLALAEIVAFFGASASVEQVAARWMEYRSFARSQPIKVWLGGPGKKADMKPIGPDASLLRDTGRTRSAARTNRYLDQLSALLRQAHATRGPGGRPLLEFMPTIERIAEDKRDPNPVPLDIVGRIEADAAAPAHLRYAAALVRLFGFRLDEVFGLTVGRIDWENCGYRLQAAKTKAGRDEFMPANVEAMQLLERLAAEANARAPRDRAALLIVYTPPGRDRTTGKPKAPRAIKNARKAWASALKRAGVAGEYRFHDLRATFITQIAEVASAATTQDLARHTSPATTKRYTKISDQAKRAAIDAMQSPDAQSRWPIARLVK
ncbi:MAG: tyrosine-type recombinase/integrase [Rhodospirillales bacterium]|jgi:integrase